MTRRRLTLPVLLASAALLAGCGSSSSSTTRAAAASSPSTGSSSTATAATATSPAASQLGPEGIPLEPGSPLAPASTTTPGTPVDGVRCAPIEQLVYHIHAHLQVYVNGEPRALPAAIGLIAPVSEQTPYGPFYGAQRCYYWLHTHASDGVIHVESPGARVYTLGTFFDEWREPLSGAQVASATGKVTAFVDGKPWKRDPRTIALLPHAAIQLDVGSPTPAPQPVSWAGTSL